MLKNTGDELVSAQEASRAKLRAKIFAGEFRAGHRLRQEELARQVGVSRLPVRAALNRIATEGLVELTPRRGFFVTSLNANEIEDIFEMRSMLEERADYLATTWRTAVDVDVFDALVDSLDAAPATPAEFEEWADLNLHFHMRLYQSCGRKHLCLQIDLLRGTLAPLIRLLAREDGESRRSQEEHRQMLVLFRAGDAAAVSRLCREHCAYMARSLVSLLRAARADQPDNDPRAA
jgi:DNA-binding GntR family transcriptional regulator